MVLKRLRENEIINSIFIDEMLLKLSKVTKVVGKYFANRPKRVRWMNYTIPKPLSMG
jgi:hypothetical protein